LIELPVALRVPVDDVVVDEVEPVDVDFDPLPEVEGGEPEATVDVDEDFEVADPDAPLSVNGTDWVRNDKMAASPAAVAPMTSGARLTSSTRNVWQGCKRAPI